MMNKMFKINGNPEQYKDLDVFHKLAQQFLPYAHKKLGFDKPVGVNLLSDPENLKDPLGKTAYYDPNKMEITLFVDKRHVKDILRSMAHELVHHTQNCRGEFDGGIKTGPGYAQDDEHMRKMEAEAYLKGSGFLLRDWEDSLKENKTMSKKKLKEDAGSAARLLRTAAEEGASEEDLEALRAKAGVPEPDLSLGPNRLEPGPLPPHMRGGEPFQLADSASNYKFIERMDAAGFTIAEISEILGIGEEEIEIATGTDPQEFEGQFEGVDKTLEEEEEEKPMEEEVNESWFKGSKDQLLFERLVDKWIK